MENAESDPGSHRLQTFSDAVFAFACTLLVVSLEVPKSFAELRADLRGFVAFGLAFAALIYIWSIHHRLFRRYSLSDDWSVLLNACLLFVVLFFVYPLKFLCVQLSANVLGIGSPSSANDLSLGDLRSLFVIYGGAYAAIFFMFAILCWHGSRNTAGRARLGTQAESDATLYRHYLVVASIAALSVLVALSGWGLAIGLPGWVYFLTAPATWVNGVYVDRGRRASSQKSRDS